MSGSLSLPGAPPRAIDSRPFRPETPLRGGWLRGARRFCGYQSSFGRLAFSKCVVSPAIQRFKHPFRSGSFILQILRIFRKQRRHPFAFVNQLCQFADDCQGLHQGLHNSHPVVMRNGFVNAFGCTLRVCLKYVESAFCMFDYFGGFRRACSSDTNRKPPEPVRCFLGKIRPFFAELV